MQASIAVAGDVITVDEVASCRVTVFTAYNVYTYLFDGGPLDGPYLLEVGVDEGAAPFAILSAVRGEYEGFNGQDNSAGSYWSAELAGGIGEPINQLTMQPLAGFAAGDVSVSFDPTSDTEDCATGVLGLGSYEAAPEYLSRFETLPNDVLIEQQGGGGDVIYVTRVSEFEGPDRYLSWTQPPVGPSGGLSVVDC